MAFAIAGSLKAADADLDLFGVVVLGVVTALGGGTTRDVLVGRTPTSLASVGDVTVALVGVAIAVVVVALATVTAVGGGSIADVLLGRVPVVLREDFYATPALGGGGAFWLSSTVGASAGVSTLVCTVSVLALRGLALRHDWQLPTV